MWLYWPIWIATVIYVVSVARHNVCEAQSLKGMEPWTSKDQPADEAKHHVEEISSARQVYTVTHGGTVDGRSCRSPVGAYGGFTQTWESNRREILAECGSKLGPGVLAQWRSSV